MSDDKSNYINNLKFYIYLLSELHITNLLIRLIMIIRGLSGKYPTCGYIFIPVDATVFTFSGTTVHNWVSIENR